MGSFTKKAISSLLIVVIAFSVVFSDCILTNAATSKQIIFELDTIENIMVCYGDTFYKDGITISGDNDVFFVGASLDFTFNWTSVTFTSEVGEISRVEIYCYKANNISEDWTLDGNILSWSGTPSVSVTLGQRSAAQEEPTPEPEEPEPEEPWPGEPWPDDPAPTPVDPAPEEPEEPEPMTPPDITGGGVYEISRIVFYIGGVTVYSISLYNGAKPAEPFTLYSLDTVGNKASLSAVIHPDEADKTVVWSSSDTSVAIVDSTGLVTGIGEGEATITATATNGNYDASDDKSVSCLVFVEDAIMPDSGPTGKAIQLVNSFNPSGGIRGKGQDHIYFGRADEFYQGYDRYWRVLDNEKSNAGEENCMFLMTENLIGIADGYDSNYKEYYDRYNDDPDNPDYLTSSWTLCYSRAWAQVLYKLYFSSAEKQAIKRTFYSEPHHYIGRLEFWNNYINDEIFYLSLKELSDPSYGFTDEASRVATFKGSPSYYWTRSAYESFISGGHEYVMVAGIASNGSFLAVEVTLQLHIRYGMNLDMTKVFFTSPAVDVKTSEPMGTLNPVSSYSGSDWKLTLLDSSRKFTVTDFSVSGNTVSINYSNAVEGDNEYISAMIVNPAGKVTYYGRLAKASSVANTSLTFDLGYNYDAGDKLYIFNEQCNGDKYTDYSSEPITISLSTGTHSWAWVIDTPPTCAKAGTRHEECTVCHEKRKENTPVAPTGIHEFEWFIDKEPTHYEPGYQHAVCKICGVTMYENTEIEPLPLPQFISHSLVLSGEIGVNYFMDLPMIGDLDYENSYMEFKVSGKNGATTQDFFDPDHKNQSDEFFGFTCYINSIQMAETISATFHYFLNGEEQTLELEDYSVEEYLNTLIIEDEFDGTVKQLAVATAEYGYYAQQYFSEKNEWEFGEDHTPMPVLNSMNSDGYSDQACKDVLRDIGELEKDLGELGLICEPGNSGIKKVTYALVLDKATGIKLYLTPDQDYFDHNIRVTFGDDYDNFEDLELQEDGRYHIYIQGISAHELADVFTIHVRAKEDFDIKVCALSYVKAVLNSDTSNDRLKNLAVAIYNYYDKTMLFRWANQYTY